MPRTLRRRAVLVVVACFVCCAPPDTSPADLDRVATAATDWLVRHQLDDGSWSAAAFDLACPSDDDLCDGLAGTAVHDVGVTALATLALLASPDSAARHASDAERAVAWLVATQHDDGLLGDPNVGDHTYDHALGTLALARASALLGRDDLRPAVAAAADRIAAMRTPDEGWRYADFHIGMRAHRSDTSVTSWMLAALRAARDAGAPVDEESLADGLAFVVEMTDDDEARARQAARDELAAARAELERRELLDDDSAAAGHLIDAQRSYVETLEADLGRARATGRAGYVTRGGHVDRLPAAVDAFPYAFSEACTAAALVSRLAEHEGPALDDAQAMMLDRCLALPPDVRVPEGFDGYAWHFVSSAVADPRVRPADARAWRRALAATLVATQRDAGCARGSFDPHRFAWGSPGGRVYQTAILALAAQAHHGRVLPTR